MPYLDLNTIHTPAVGANPPASWGSQIRANDEFLARPPVVVAFHSTTQSIPNKHSRS